MSEASERLRQDIANPNVLLARYLKSSITAVLDELAALQEAHARLADIYARRGETIAEMRTLMDGCS